MHVTAIRSSGRSTLAQLSSTHTEKFPRHNPRGSHLQLSPFTTPKVQQTTSTHTIPTTNYQTDKMGKERVEKKEKKDKKEKRSDDGVKKAKKEKKVKVVDETVVAALEEQLEASEAPVAEAKVLVTEQDGELVVKPVGALVPFAAPLADDKVAKKVLKSVKKGKLLSITARGVSIGGLLGF